MDYSQWNDGIFGREYDRSSTANSLSPYVIGDTLLRSELFRDIRRAQGSPDLRERDAWGSYTVGPDETLRPDLVAYRAYSVDGLRWVVQVAAGLDDMRGAMEAGTVLFLPTVAWLHGRIRRYAGLEVRT